MSIGFTGRTKAFALQADKPIIVASRNLYRKGIYLASHDTLDTWVALGASPAPEDFFKLKPFEPLVFDHMAVVGPVWARGAGRIVVIDSMDPVYPFNPANLFIGGKRGIWIDPHDPATMFSDEAGTVQAVEGDEVKCLINKADGLKFTVLPGWSGPRLRRRNYQNYLEFKDSAMKIPYSYKELSDRCDIGNYFAAGLVVTDPAQRIWSGIAGNNAGSGAGFHFGPDNRAVSTVPDGFSAFRLHANRSSINATTRIFGYGDPVVIGGSIQTVGNTINIRAYLDGSRIQDISNNYIFDPTYVTQSDETYLGTSWKWATPDETGGRKFNGELHGLILAVDVSQEDRHRIDMYLGADVGAPVNSES